MRASSGLPTLFRISGCLLAYAIPFALLLRHRGPDPPLGLPFVTLLCWLLSLGFAISAFRSASDPRRPVPLFARYLGRYVWAGPVLATVALALTSALAPQPFDVSVFNATDEELSEAVVTFDTGYSFRVGVLVPHATATHAFASLAVPTQARLFWRDSSGATRAAQIPTAGVLPKNRWSRAALLFSISLSGVTCMSPAFPERIRSSSPATVP